MDFDNDQDWRQLQNAWRAIPLPESADRARVAFLERLPRRTLPLQRPPRRSLSLPRWIAAAVLVLGIGIPSWLIGPAPEAHASPVIERLVDWNLEISRTDPADRGSLLASREAALRAEVAQTPLPPSERELADMLLDNGSWLAVNDNPVDAVERFDAVADKLVEQMQNASAKRQMHLAKRYARLQALVAEQGVARNLTKAEEAGALNFDNPGRIEKKIMQRQQKRKAAVTELLDQDPTLETGEVRKSLDYHHKHPKHHSTKKSATSSNRGSTQP